MKPTTRARKARRFPENTCPASRHTQMIGEDLIRYGSNASSIISHPKHVGESLLLTVAALWEARDEIERLKRNAK